MPITIDANPVRADLKLYRGDDFFLEITVVEPGTSEPTDLSGVYARAQIRSTADDVEIAADFAVDQVDNVITLHLASLDSALLPASCVWDCQLEWPDTTITTLVSGRVTLTDEVTR